MGWSSLGMWMSSTPVRMGPKRTSFLASRIWLGAWRLSRALQGT